MKVILLKNVDNLGQKDDVKEVKVGFWRNFLMPGGLAVEATQNLLKQVEKRREERLEQEKAKEEKLTKLLQELKDKVLSIKVKADEKGGLFAGINSKNISEELKKQFKIDVPDGVIELKGPIKKIGSYEALIKDVVLKIEIRQL